MRSSVGIGHRQRKTDRTTQTDTWTVNKHAGHGWVVAKFAGRSSHAQDAIGTRTSILHLHGKYSAGQMGPPTGRRGGTGGRGDYLMACSEHSAQHCRPGIRAVQAPAQDAGLLNGLGRQTRAAVLQALDRAISGGRSLHRWPAASRGPEYCAMPVRFARFQRLPPGPGST